MACYNITNTKAIKKCQLSLNIVAIELKWNIIMVAKWKRWSTDSGGIKAGLKKHTHILLEA